MPRERKNQPAGKQTQPTTGGKTLSPPAFQLKAQPPVQRKGPDKKHPGDKGNTDLMKYHWRGDRLLDESMHFLRTQRKFTQEALEDQGGKSYHKDMRFLLVMAMRFTEQSGFGSVRNPQGNNAYNIMGEGPDGSFERKDNHEEVNGVSVKTPAKFAKYKTDKDGTTAFFEILKQKWPEAYTAIMNGDKIPTYAKGLRPKGKSHYLTKNLADHIKNLNRRVLGLVHDLKMAHTATLQDIETELSSLEPTLTHLLTHKDEGDLELRKQRIENWSTLQNRKETLLSYRTEITTEIGEFDNVRARVLAGESVQDQSLEIKPSPQPATHSQGDAKAGP